MCGFRVDIFLANRKTREWHLTGAYIFDRKHYRTRKRVTANMLSFSPKVISKEFLADLPERSRKVLTFRFGLHVGGERRTLDAIGKEYGITRERIRQIENHGLQTIRQSKAYAKHVKPLEDLKKLLQELGGVLPEHVLVETVAKNTPDRSHVLFILTVGHHFSYKREDAQYHARWHVDRELAEAVERALEQLYTSLELHQLTPEEEFLDLFKKALVNEGVRINEDALTRWLSISKKLGKNQLGEWGKTESPHVRIRNTRDFAYLTLKRHGSPMHFTEVARGIESLFTREAHPATTHNELIKDKRFVLVGRGLYALNEWGYNPGVVRDVIQNILEREGSLTKNEIIERVKRERYVKDATVLVNLQNGQFARDGSGKYSIA